jgi:predicted NAD/FAD-binding protein
MNDKHTKSRVAIIGTGLAGLSSAYLIKGDRYRVTLFEQVRHVVNDNRDPLPWV